MASRFDPKDHDWLQLGAPQQKQKDEQEGCPWRGRRATGETPVRCVENANGLRAGSSAEGKVMGVEMFLCPLGRGVHGRPVAAREVDVGRSSIETRSQGSRGSTHHDSGRQRELSGRDAAKYAPHTQAPEPTAACLQGATGLAQGSGAVAYCSAKNAETASLQLDAWTPPYSPVGTPTVYANVTRAATSKAGKPCHFSPTAPGQ